MPLPRLAAPAKDTLALKLDEDSVMMSAVIYTNSGDGSSFRCWRATTTITSATYEVSADYGLSRQVIFATLPNPP